MKQVAKIECTNNLKQDIKDAVAQIGGMRNFIKPGENVLLKPNFNTADPFPASSDPEFIKAVAELVLDCGARKVTIGDCSTFTQDTKENIEKLKIREIAGEKINIVAFDDYKWIEKEINAGKFVKKIPVAELLDKADKLILLPCLKTHSLTKFTGSLKLSVGFVKPLYRLKLHAGHLQEKVAELNSLIHPTLVIMDARKCFITKGPSQGEVREPGLILASESRVACDLEGIKIIQSFEGNSLAGIDPLQLPQIKRAIEMNID